jgi:hypothetical protein
MGSKLGAITRAAQAIGLTHDEYVARVASGEKWCCGCRAWHAVSCFGADTSRGDGLSTICVEFRAQRAKARYTPRPHKRGRKYNDARDGDRKQARGRVNHLVRMGLLPRPATLPCHDCGHVGPGRRHEYDHHLGYTAEHHEHVQAVCTVCHNLRTIGETPLNANARQREARALAELPCSVAHLMRTLEMKAAAVEWLLARIGAERIGKVDEVDRIGRTKARPLWGLPSHRGGES